MSYLPTRVCISVRKSHLLNLRNFFETAARERWLPIAAERMIIDEEYRAHPSRSLATSRLQSWTN